MPTGSIPVVLAQGGHHLHRNKGTSDVLRGLILPDPWPSPLGLITASTTTLKILDKIGFPCMTP